MLLTSFFLLARISASIAQDRIVVPIHALERHGTVRYWIPVTIGGKTVEALFDTGSTGLHVMSNAINGGDVTPTGGDSRNSYSNGQTLHGDIATATVSLGASAPQQMIKIDVVQSISCDAPIKRCQTPANKRHANAGELIGEGNYSAIFGASMPSPSLQRPVGNPLVKFGDAWIVRLPGHGEKTGALIINPDANDLKGFVLYPAGQGPNQGGGRDNPIPGCLGIEGSSKQYCGPFVFDTGMSSVFVITTQDLHILRSGTKVTMAFGEGSDHALKAGFKVDDAQMNPARVAIGPFPNFHQAPTRVLIGVEGYEHFSVLYDYKNGQIGLKPL
jgi:hypothetical protein